MKKVSKDIYDSILNIAKKANEDGLVLEITIPNVSLYDWEIFLSEIREHHNHSFIGKCLGDPLPIQLDAVFFDAEEISLLVIDLNNYTLACYFFDSNEIELDLVPSALNDENLDPLIGLVQRIGKLLDKTVHISIEATNPVISYSHGQFNVHCTNKPVTSRQAQNEIPMNF